MLKFRSGQGLKAAALKSVSHLLNLDASRLLQLHSRRLLQLRASHVPRALADPLVHETSNSGQASPKLRS